MRREIYEVTARIVDANGAYAFLDDKRAVFDSKLYGNDLKRTLSRALAAKAEIEAAFYKRDDRQEQIVTIMRLSDGRQIYKNDEIGKLADLPDPEPEPEPEPDEGGEDEPETPSGEWS